MDPHPNWARVGYQGEPGAYSEEAAIAVLPQATTIGFPTFTRAFDALASREVDAAVLPVENSLGGIVQEVNDLLWERSGVRVSGEVIHPVRHCLLGRGEPVVRALSHPQALLQCRKFLEARGIQPVSFHDTAAGRRHEPDSLRDRRPRNGRKARARPDQGVARVHRRAQTGQPRARADVLQRARHQPHAPRLAAGAQPAVAVPLLRRLRDLGSACRLGSAQGARGGGDRGQAVRQLSCGRMSATTRTKRKPNLFESHIFDVETIELDRVEESFLRGGRHLF
ncbi:MAG: hypothetical protein E6I98_06370, partial [Chloroflexi bacterium]